MSLPTLPTPRPQRTSTVYCLYATQFRVHALIEAVGATVEALVLSLWFLGSFVCQGLGQVVLGRPTAWPYSLRESVICLASCLSFALPCFTNCTIYRGFTPDADGWHLAPLWTLAGAVDPRRFRTIMCGNGGWAVEGGGDDPGRKHAQDLPPETVFYSMDSLWGPCAALFGRRYAQGYQTLCPSPPNVLPEAAVEKFEA